MLLVILNTCCMSLPFPVGDHIAQDVIVVVASLTRKQRKLTNHRVPLRASLLKSGRAVLQEPR